MAAKKQNERGNRQARERLRVYTARVTVHERGEKRRVRDNLIAGAGIVIVLVLAVSAQLMYFSGPGKVTAKPTATPTATTTPSATPTATAGANQGDVPPASLAAGRTWTGTMTINGIPLGIELDGKAAPQAVSSTISLVQKDFYNGLTCHRLTDGGFYVLQCGDPNGDGSGGPGYSYGPIENAPADNVYATGDLAMARQSGNAYSQGSQFFIVYKSTTIPADAAGGYTVIGKITSGLDQLNADVTSKGITPVSSANDGKPKVATKIDSITLK
ncbi:peptidylprolyl isomerase [Rathayibacter soli]|uniref:peptidylprolyl isomerase n=1 Tax=Rathayibacter soli TaxID=3144168 RepID=UPI0027E51166|nr:peptidylprolyl isomerase [Glaciibacter superstes]